MDARKFDRLKEMRERFRALPSKQREALGIAMLKVNLGVNGPEDLAEAKAFLGDLPLELKPGKLGAFLDFLHSASAITPPEISGWYTPEDFGPPHKDLPGYSEDEVETLKDDIPRPGRKGSSPRGPVKTR